MILVVSLSYHYIFSLDVFEYLLSQGEGWDDRGGGGRSHFRWQLW